MTHNRTAIVIAAHDGLQSVCTGVGMVVHSFLQAFEPIASATRVLPTGCWDLYCLAPRLKTSAPDFDADIRRGTENLCSRHGGELIEVETLSDGECQRSVWGGVAQWRYTSESAAAGVRRLAARYRKVYCIVHDTIFAGLRIHTKDAENITVLWIPHSFGTVFHDNAVDKIRVAFERESIQALAASPADRIGYIGNAVKRTLARDYGTPKARMTPFRNRLYPHLPAYRIDPDDARRRREGAGVPPDKKLIFAWGRCAPQKGFDLLFSAFRNLSETVPDCHLVALMPLDTSDAAYVDTIRRQIDGIEPNRVTAIFAFDRHLPAAILRSPELSVVIFASRFEGAPLAPIESLTLAGPHVRHVYSAIPPHQELFRGHGGCIPFQTFSVLALHRAMKRAWSLDVTRLTPPSRSDFVQDMAACIDTAFSRSA